MDTFFDSDIEYLEGISPIPFDIFLRFDEKYIKIVQGNSEPYSNLWTKIKNKKISKVYIKTSDEFVYISLGINKLRRLKLQTKETKILFSTIVNATNAIFVNLQKNGANKTNISLLNTAAGELIDLVKSTEVSLSFISDLAKNRTLFSHSLYRTVLSLAAAKNLDWTSNYSQTKIATASLLADISIKDNCGVIFKEKEALSDSESELFRSHMFDSVETLSKTMALSKEISLAILHHHENADGSGPLRVSKFEIYPLGHVIRISDEIARLTIPNSSVDSVMNYNTALDIVSNSKVGMSNILAGFKKIA